MVWSSEAWVSRFKQEARQHLAGIVKHLDLLQSLLAQQSSTLSEAEVEGLREAFRLAHTIKGSAGMVGQIETAQLAQTLEEMLGKAYKKEQNLSQKQHTEAHKLVEQLRQNLEPSGDTTGLSG